MSWIVLSPVRPLLYWMFSVEDLLRYYLIKQNHLTEQQRRHLYLLEFLVLVLFCFLLLFELIFFCIFFTIIFCIPWPICSNLFSLNSIRFASAHVHILCKTRWRRSVSFWDFIFAITFLSSANNLLTLFSRFLIYVSYHYDEG